jgi:hypothetical protein
MATTMIRLNVSGINALSFRRVRHLIKERSNSKPDTKPAITRDKKRGTPLCDDRKSIKTGKMIFNVTERLAIIDPEIYL